MALPSSKQHCSGGSTSSLEEGELPLSLQDSGVIRAVQALSSPEEAFREPSASQGWSSHASDQVFPRLSEPQPEALLSIIPSVPLGEQDSSVARLQHDRDLTDNPAQPKLEDSDQDTQGWNEPMEEAVEGSAIIKQSPTVVAGPELSSTSDSDLPLNIASRDRQSNRLSSSPIIGTARLIAGNSGSQVIGSPTKASRPRIKIEDDEDDDDLFDGLAPTSPSGPLVESNKYQADIDWIDRCKRCIKKDLRCYTATGARLDRKRCQECVEHHRLCIVDGINVSWDLPQAELKPKPKQRKKMASTRRRSQRRITASQQTPVVLTAGSGPQIRMRARKSKLTAITKGGTRKSAAKPQDHHRDVADTSSISSAPESDQEEQTACSSAGVSSPAVMQTESEGSRPKLDIPCPLRLEGNAKERDRTLDAEQDSLAALKQPAKAQQGPNQDVEKYTAGLIKDIASAIRRCKERIATMSDRAGLMVLETTMTILVNDLHKLLSSENELCAGKRTHWIVPQPAEYLQSIRQECQSARETEDQELEAEMQAKQVAAISASETLLERCLTLITMHVGETCT